MVVSESKSLLGYLSDPRLALYATGDVPVWLWSADATHILWGNPTAAAIFNAASPTALSGHTIDPKGSAALQIARLARRIVTVDHLNNGVFVIKTGKRRSLAPFDGPLEPGDRD